MSLKPKIKAISPSSLRTTKNLRRVTQWNRSGMRTSSMPVGFILRNFLQFTGLRSMPSSLAERIKIYKEDALTRGAAVNVEADYLMSANKGMPFKVALKRALETIRVRRK